MVKTKNSFVSTEMSSFRIYWSFLPRIAKNMLNLIFRNCWFSRFLVIFSVFKTLSALIASKNAFIMPISIFAPNIMLRVRINQQFDFITKIWNYEHWFKSESEFDIFAHCVAVHLEFLFTQNEILLLFIFEGGVAKKEFLRARSKKNRQNIQFLFT